MRWARGPIDRSGMRAYTHLIRSPRDPERAEWRNTDNAAAWRRRLNKRSPEELAVEIHRHMADGVPRTFNRIAVEMIDKTADVVFGTSFDDALWQLVDRGDLQLTLLAPIRFRRRKEDGRDGHR